MERILKNQFSVGQRSQRILHIFLLLVAVFSIALFFALQQSVQRITFQEAEKDLETLSKLSAHSIEREFESRMTALDTIADSIRAVDIEEITPLIPYLAIYRDNYDFRDVGILTTDGILHTTTGKTYDTTDLEPFVQVLQGEEVISDAIPALNGDPININVLAVPVVRNNQVICAVAATFRARDLATSLNVRVFQSDGFSIIVDRRGRVMTSPTDTEGNNFYELLQYIDVNPDIRPLEDQHGMRFSFSDDRYYATFEPLNLNDWFLMTCAPTSVVFGDATLVMRRVMLYILCLWVLVIVAVGLVALVYGHSRRNTQKLVFEDKLLGGYNFEYLQVLFPQISPEARKQIAFFVMDVDKFKEFNFVYGSQRGDDLLRYIAHAFSEELPQDKIYRYTADRFAGLLYGSDRQSVEIKLQKLLQRFERDIRNKAIEVFAVSIGVCKVGEGDTLQVVYSDALIAKNTIKNSHVQSYNFYDEEMRKKRLDRMKLESDFQEALENGEFQAYYQPKVDSRTGTIVGAEALVRWQRSDGTLVSPGVFIPYFEEGGQIVQLDEAMLQKVCEHMQDMQRAGIPIVPVSVNLSRVHLQYPGIADKIKQLLETMQVDPHKLHFEITESALYEASIPLKEVVAQLHALGCLIDMDDYGTGVSGPNSLANNSFDVLKLDKSFVDRQGDDRMEVVISSTIQMAHRLGMDLVAEGVETKAQMEHLQELGCPYIQGYYYSRPVPYEEYREMMRTHRRFTET